MATFTYNYLNPLLFKNLFIFIGSYTPVDVNFLIYWHWMCSQHLF